MILLYNLQNVKTVFGLSLLFKEDIIRLVAKEIAELVGIEKKLTHHIAKKKLCNYCTALKWRVNGGCI